MKKMIMKNKMWRWQTFRLIPEEEMQGMIKQLERGIKYFKKEGLLEMTTVSGELTKVGDKQDYLILSKWLKPLAWLVNRLSFKI